MARAKSRYWDGVAEVWNTAHPQELWRVHSDTVNLDLLGRWLPAGRVQYLLKTDAFDEAFGNGLYPLLATKAERIVGVDVSVSTLRLARTHHTNLRVVGADVRCLPFADGVFDILVSTSTLDHFPSHDEIRASLHEFRRVLRPAGQLLLTLDNLANPLISLRNALSATYGPYGLRCVLQEVGFNVLEVGTVMHCPRVLAVAIARLLERHTGPETQRRFLGFLLTFERLASWPTRFLTGHFVAVRAIKP